MSDIRQQKTRPSVLKHLDGCMLDGGHLGPCRRASSNPRLEAYVSDRVNPVAPQPDPKGGRGDIWNLVIQDMIARKAQGIERYGTPLKADNGRDALVDLYQELLDACAYVRQLIEEGNGK